VVIEIRSGTVAPIRGLAVQVVWLNLDALAGGIVMTRKKVLGSKTLACWTWMLAAGVAGCGSASSGTPWTGSTGGGTAANGNAGSGNTGGGTAGNGAAAASGSSGGSAASGSTSGSGTAGSGTAGTGTTAGSGSTAGSGASSGTPDAAAASSADPSGVTIWSGPDATDLAAPAPSDGFQIASPDYNANDANAKQLVVPAGQEIFLCYYVTIPGNANINVGAIRSWMTGASSHHFILYQLSQPSLTSGTINTCSTSAGTWVYGTSSPGRIVGMDMPSGVGLPMSAGTQLVVNMHFINPGATAIYPKLKVNLFYAKNIQYTAGVVTSFNASIDIPPATANGPGTQTVSGTCHAPVGAHFFQMATHTHKHATVATIDYTTGGQTTRLVYTGTTQTYPTDQVPGTGTDYQHPGVAMWNAPDFLTLKAGDSFTYSCSYANSGTTAVTVGETAASNEMCMMMGYYYPVGSTSCN
jgi:Copper type II ascorbate-dependent monooxygenase, C-terminal domain